MLNNRILPNLLKAVDQIVWVVWEPRELEEANHQVPDYISYLFLQSYWLYFISFPTKSLMITFHIFSYKVPDDYISYIFLVY